MKKELLDNMKSIVLIDSAALFTKFETSVALCHFQLCTQCSVLEINSAYFEQCTLHRPKAFGNKPNECMVGPS